MGSEMCIRDRIYTMYTHSSFIDANVIQPNDARLGGLEVKEMKIKIGNLNNGPKLFKPKIIIIYDELI